MDITTKRYLIELLIFFRFIANLEGCSKGLTPLRYPISYELMYCVPTTRNRQDPCQSFSGSQEAYCQRDFGDEFVCCGSVDLFIEILENGERKLPSFQQFLRKDFPVPDYSKKDDHRLLNSIHVDYNSELAKWAPLNLRPTTTTIGTPIVFPYKAVPSLEKPTTEKPNPRPSTSWPIKPLTSRPITYRTFSLPPITRRTTNPSLATKVFTTIKAPIPLKEEKYIVENGPVLSLITSGHFMPGNNSVSWSAPSTITLLQDGHCTVVINTGLSIQKNDIVASLAAKGFLREIFNYTVITSGHPQFIGNLHLFDARTLIIGMLSVQRSVVSSHKMDKTMRLCSPNTEIVHAPGPSPDAISVIAKNVRGMGTVAITGALFIQDDRLSRVDFPFVWNHDQLFASRKRIICISDWIIPGHSVPIPVTRALKKEAAC